MAPYSTSSHSHLEASLTWRHPPHPSWSTPSLMEASKLVTGRPSLSVERRQQLCFHDLPHRVPGAQNSA